MTSISTAANTAPSNVGRSLTIGGIAARSGLGQSTTSEQLTILRRGGLVTSTRDGELVQYRADTATITARLGELQHYLDGCCPQAPFDSSDLQASR